MSGGTLAWLIFLTVWNLLVTWWAMVDDTRIKRFEGKP